MIRGAGEFTQDHHYMIGPVAEFRSVPRGPKIPGLTTAREAEGAGPVGPELQGEVSANHHL